MMKEKLIPPELKDDESFLFLVEEMVERISAVKDKSEEIQEKNREVDILMQEAEKELDRLTELRDLYNKIIKKRAPDFESSSAQELSGIEDARESSKEQQKRAASILKQLPQDPSIQRHVGGALRHMLTTSMFSGLPGMTAPPTLPDARNVGPRFPPDHPAARYLDEE